MRRIPVRIIQPRHEQTIAPLDSIIVDLPPAYASLSHPEPSTTKGQDEEDPPSYDEYIRNIQQ